MTVVPENTDNSMALVRSNWNLECWFLRREENRRTRRKTLVARERTNNQLNSHEVPEQRIEPTTHWHHSGERRAYYRNATHAMSYNSAISLATIKVPDCICFLQYFNLHTFQKNKVDLTAINYFKKLRNFPECFTVFKCLDGVFPTYKRDI
jgi:hypothetical protein